MQKSEFSIKINLHSASLMANHWCLWIETTPQLWIQSWFTYLYLSNTLWKYTLPELLVSLILTSIIPAAITAHVLQNSAIKGLFPWRGKRKKRHKWVPGPFRLLLPLPGPDPYKHSRTSPAWTHFYSLQQAQQTHSSGWDWGLQSDAGQLFSLALQPLIS